MDQIFFKIDRSLKRSSYLQLILVSIGIHSLVAIFIILIHLNYYLDTENLYKRANDIIQRDQGGIISPKSKDVNLILNKIIKQNEIDYNGWWFDHAKYHFSIKCYNSKFPKCIKVFSTECKYDRIRAIYQYLPVKRGVYLNTIHMSLRALVHHLVEEEIADHTYGLHALLHLSNNDTQIIRLDLPMDLEEWGKRSLTYTTPSGTYITDITAMLLCYGYQGSVSFTDITISVPNEMEKSLTRQDIITSCPSDSYNIHPFTELHQYKSQNFPIFDLKNDSVKSSQLTLVTQVSLDRISNLETTLQSWNGPVSLAIFLPVKNMSEDLLKWQRVYVEKKVKSLQFAAGSKITLVTALESDIYPINVLRNLAIKSATTKYILLLDADFQPCPDLENKFLDSIKSTEDNTKKAFVVPAFEYLSHPKKKDTIPTTKEELLQLIFRNYPLVQPFRIIESVEAHRLTNYWKWYMNDNVYHVEGFSDKFEPYLILEKQSHLSLYDEGFSGYGMNKVIHTTELFMANYEFYVLPNVWVIHLPHKKSSYFQEFLQNTTQRLWNRAQRFQFVRKIMIKYNSTQAKC